jgi:hypothetical protein
MHAETTPADADALKTRRSLISRLRGFHTDLRRGIQSFTHSFLENSREAISAKVKVSSEGVKAPSREQVANTKCEACRAFWVAPVDSTGPLLNYAQHLDCVCFSTAFVSHAGE